MEKNILIKRRAKINIIPAQSAKKNKLTAKIREKNKIFRTQKPTPPLIIKWPGPNKFVT